MLSRAVCASRICLPCRRRLGQAYVPRLALGRPYSGSVESRFDSMFRRRRTDDPDDDDDDDSLLGGSWNTATNTIEPVVSSSHLDTEDTRTSAVPEPIFEPPPDLPRRKGFEHELLRQQMLSMGALGKSVDALILKNPNNLYRKKRPDNETLVEDDTASSPPTSLFSEMLPKADGGDVLSEAFRNIDEMRPPSLQSITRREFDRLATELLQGFTYAQLVHYLQIHKKAVSEKATPTESYEWMEQKGTWQAASPMEWGILKPKQRQVLLILQLVWGLEVSEHIEGMGRTPIWVKPIVTRLLSHPSDSVLDNIKQAFLDESRGDNIVTQADESLVVIYSSKPMADHIVKQMDLALQALKTKTVSAAHVLMLDLEPKMLQAVGIATRTDVQYLPDTNSLQVSWLPDSSRHSSSATDDPADLVSRLLVRPHDFDRETSVVIPQPNKRTSVRSGRFHRHHRELKSMNWRDQMLAWSRYVAPVASRAKKGKSKNYHLAKKPYIAVTEQQKGEDSIDACVELNATFGHVLHQAPKDAMIGSIKGRRILSPLLPHPVAFSDFRGTPTLSTDVVITLTSRDGLEEIRLQLPMSPDSTASPVDLLPDAKLFRRRTQATVDILMPHEICDVRVEQTRHEPIEPSSQPSLREFLAASEFNMSTAHLRTPSELSILVGSHPTTYQLSTLHLSTTVSLPSSSMRITAIQGGPSTGQREQLSVHASIPAMQAQAASKDQVSAFLRLVEDVVTGRKFPWTHTESVARRGTQAVDEEEPELSERDEADADGWGATSAAVVGEPIQEAPSWPSNITFGPQGEHVDWWAEHVEKKNAGRDEGLPMHEGGIEVEDGVKLQEEDPPTTVQKQQ